MLYFLKAPSKEDFQKIQYTAISLEFVFTILRNTQMEQCSLVSVNFIPSVKHHIVFYLCPYHPILQQGIFVFSLSL